ncbi:ABC transporter permease [Acidocella aromatica]|uniref:Putative hydroxymethylpyrimidine transport system permease protein n=1 Tax=Acidocella aromatica TaxID=1303579 RepID=A0A840VKU6_9PROT|nr:ABC transporter permease [Acidocella aromatica]MBB5372110.1 putative hydroxymethylpyrimidine transport system permease protein [Acidocella aromatica]
MIRPFITLAGFIALWWAMAAYGGVPPYMLPSPQAVGAALWTQREYLATNAGVTLAEIAIGLTGGTILGALAALGVAASPVLQRWLLPVLVLSQAIPVFALAPLMVLWLGFGLTSKVAMAMLVIFFPVTANFLDGLRRTEAGWLDLARTMNAKPLYVLLRLRLPAALPALGSGLRVAAAVAPIGAILGEWVGASSGLGYVMLNANARIQPDLMFAALVVLMAIAIGLYVAVDKTLRRLLRWAPGS